MPKKNYELKAERIRRNKSAKYMSDLLGYAHPNPYYERERGVRSFSQDQIILIAKDFGFSKDDIGRVFFNEEIPVG